MAHSTWIATTVLACFIPGTGFAAPGEPLKYKLEPGLVLRYERTYESRGTLNSSSTMHDEVQVLRKNDDGSHRVLVQSKTSIAYDDSPREREVEVACADVMPDGRFTVLTNPAASRLGQFFPPLPTGDEAEWSGPEPMGDTVTYRLKEDATPDTVMFTTESHGPMVDVYGIKRRETLTFDREAGLLIASEGTVEQTYGFQTQGTTTLKLASRATGDATTLESLGAETDRYVETLREYEKAMKGLTDPTGAGRGKAILEEAATRITQPILASALATMLERHDQSVTYREKYIQPVGKIIRWNLEDLEGQRHALADYQGKVVVLDFWYRGCGWCIRAMPQMNQLVADFEGRPVAILGINNDRDVNDARFVADKLALAYPTLLGSEVPEQYGVQAFPTLLILDQRGYVRDVHVGWSANLRAEVTAKVEKLLAETE